VTLPPSQFSLQYQLGADIKIWLCLLLRRV
jgi:hypothetical protein